MKNIIYPTSEEIIENIIDYINNSIYRYAVLIDGAWGSGKTWFIKNELVPAIEKVILNEDSTYKRVVYLTLNGLKSTDEISSKLFFNIFPKSESGVAKKISSITGTVLKGLNINVDANDMGKIIEAFTEMSEYIFIFDDLERCRCDVAEVLGYINQFVEHHNTKVIIIANEEEIEGYSLAVDSIQYLVASKSNIVTSSKDESDKYTPKQLGERVDEIFNSTSNYEKIKEKVIGQTIKYKPVLKDTMKKLISENVEKISDLYTVLMELVDNLGNCIEEELSYNLRTFQFFLSVIIRLNLILCEKKQWNPYYQYNEAIRDVANYCFYVCIDYKQGNYNIPWDKDDLHTSVRVGNSWIDSISILGFAFVDYAVVYNVYDKPLIELTMNSYGEHLEKLNTNAQKAYLNDVDVVLLSSWWEQTEKDVMTAIKNLHNKVINNEMPPIKYISIIQLILPAIIEGNIERKEFDQMCQYMINRLQNEKVDFQWRDFTFFSSSEKLNKEYKEIISKIKNSIEVKKKDSEVNVAINIFENDNWGELLYDDLLQRERNQQLELKDKSLISKMDINKLAELIESSKSKQIVYFRNYIAGLYDFGNIYQYYKHDIPNLDNLLNKIKEMDKSSFDKIKIRNIELLEDLIAEKLKQLNI